MAPAAIATAVTATVAAHAYRCIAAAGTTDAWAFYSPPYDVAEKHDGGSAPHDDLRQIQ
jgi:hypothetical protein